MIFDIIKAIEDAKGSKAKTQILIDNKDNVDLKRAYLLAYSGRFKFFIKKVPEYTPVKYPNVPSKTFSDGLDYLQDILAARVLTGNMAIQGLVDLLSKMNEGDASVLVRVLLKDMRCGASGSIANKVWKKLIPEMPQMLASAYSEKALSYIKFPAFAQLKADGARCFAEIRGDELDDVTLLTRSGNEYLGLDKLKRQLIEMTKEARERHPSGVMIDGELVYHVEVKEEENDLFDMFKEPELPELSKAKEFQQTARTESNGLANKAIKGTISAEEAEGMRFQVWDYVPLDVVYSEGKVPGFAYDVRFRALEMMSKGYDKIILIENHVVHNIHEARAIYKTYVDQGLEGIILKNIGAYWEDKRSKNLVKFKEVITVDLKCVGSYEHRKQPGKMGGLMFVSECGRIRVNAGSGLKDKPEELHELDRTHLWKNRDSLPGTIWELECNGWVTAEGRDDGTVGLFLPIIKQRRYDKEVANTFEAAFGVNFTEATGIK
ncbi:gp30 DNA ligase [Klebsiella phage vB_KoM-Flushed]|nr:gp30 DNA ligase [Klebsiella phage vB_KoM-Flushed]